MILRTAQAFIGGKARPSSDLIIRYVEMHLQRGGVEHIFLILARPDSGFMTSRDQRQAQNCPLGHRAILDKVPLDELEQIRGKTFGVHRVKNLHRLMRRERLTWPQFCIR